MTTLSPAIGTIPKFQLRGLFQSVETAPVQVIVGLPKFQFVLVPPGGASTELLRAINVRSVGRVPALEYWTFTSEIF